jgi:hypothetical protein
MRIVGNVDGEARVEEIELAFFVHENFFDFVEFRQVFYHHVELKVLENFVSENSLNVQIRLLVVDAEKVVELKSIVLRVEQVEKF